MNSFKNIKTQLPPSFLSIISNQLSNEDMQLFIDSHNRTYYRGIRINPNKTSCKILTNEYNFDIGLSEIYNNMGMPLSYILIAERI